MKAVFFFDNNCYHSAHSDAEVLQAVSRAIEEQHVSTESRIPIQIADVVSMGFTQTRTKRYVIELIIHLACMLISSLPLAIFGACEQVDNNSEQRFFFAPFIVILIFFVDEKLIANNFYVLMLTPGNSVDSKYETELYIAGKTKSLNKFHKKFKPLL